MSSRASSSAEGISGIHVDLDVAEGCAPRREQALLLLFARFFAGGRRGRRPGLAANLARRGLVDQPQHVGRRVGVLHRLFLRDLLLHEQLEQRLLEGLRARRHALLQRFLISLISPFSISSAMWRVLSSTSTAASRAPVLVRTRRCEITDCSAAARSSSSAARFSSG